MREFWLCRRLPVDVVFRDIASHADEKNVERSRDIVPRPQILVHAKKLFRRLFDNIIG